MASSSGFGSTNSALTPYSDSLSLRLRLNGLNLALPISRRIMLQEARHHPFPRKRGHRAVTACKRTVSGTISLPSRGAFHLSLTVLVRYRSVGIFSLAGWSPQLHSRFHVTRVTQVPAKPSWFSLTGLSPTLVRLSSALQLTTWDLRCWSYNPASRRKRFGLFPFRSPLLRESSFLSFPPGT